MATTFAFTLSVERADLSRAEKALEEAHERIRRLELELSEFDLASPVRALNELPAGTPVIWPESAIELWHLAEKVFQDTRGAFDCLAKSDGWARASQTDAICIDPVTRAAVRRSANIRVGFGAIGKGFALDRVRLLMAQRGFQNMLLSGGGSSIFVHGFADEGLPWTWGWAWDAEGKGARFEHFSGSPIALGISGLQEQREHILDPRTGTPVIKAKTESTLIAHPSAARADALSTASFVLGWDQAHESFSTLLQQPAMAEIDSAGVPRWNGLFQNLWGAIGTAVIACLAFLEPSSTFAAEEAVDLNSLGMDGFTPYIIERSSALLALPAFTVALIFVHLIRKKRPKRSAHK